MLPQVGVSYGDLDSVVLWRTFSESNAISAIVTSEVNGELTLVMTIPVESPYASRYSIGQTVVAKVDNFRSGGLDYGGLQRFLISDIQASLDGVMTITAEHISYEVLGMAVTPFRNAAVSSLNPQEAWAKAWDNSISAPSVAHPCLRTGIDSSGQNLVLAKPAKWKDFVYGTLVATYGGELYWEGHKPTWCNRIATDIHPERPTPRLIYGKNILGLSMSQSKQDIPWGIYPYWGEQRGTVSDYRELSEKVLTVDSASIMQETVDFTSSFKTIPTQAQLRSAANTYIQENYTGKANDISIVVELADEYYQSQLTLGDDVYIQADPLGIDGTYEVKRMQYDVLRERIVQIEAGTPADTLARAVL